MILWIIGISGSGKSTIAGEVYRQWKPRAPNLVLLDGDALRDAFAFTHADAYTVEGRRRNGERMQALCRLLDTQQIHVICPILSIFEDQRARNRDLFSRYFEVYLDAALAEAEARDSKGLYAAARAGRMANVVGIDIPFTPPRSPDLVLRNGNPPIDAGLAAARILETIGAG
jgi:adenylylsulfate kinase-like enzyme